MIGQETREVERKIAAAAETSIDVTSKAMNGVIGVGELRSFWSL